MKSISIALDIAWRLALLEATEAASQFIEKEHIVIAILSLSKVTKLSPADMKLNRAQWNLVRAEWVALQEVFTALSLDATGLRRALRKQLGKSSRPQTEKVVHRSPELKAFFQIAKALAENVDEVLTLHLLAAIAGEPGTVLNKILTEQNVKPADLKKLLIKQASQGIKGPLENVPQEEKPISFLKKFGRDLTQLAEEGKLGPFIGRRQELLQVIQTLARNTKSNPVLVGEAGVGKTAIVEALAMRLIENKGPEFLKESRIIELNMGVLVAGTSYRGEFEDRLTKIIQEVTSQKEIILFIDEIHTLIGTGKLGGGMDAAQILKPALAKGDLRCIGATTIAEYRRYIEADPALERRFEKVIIEEPTRDECVEMLKGIRSKLEKHHGCMISDDAIASAVDLSIRFDSDHRLPDKAIDLLDRAGACEQAPRLTMVGHQDHANAITAESIAEMLSIKVRIPIDLISGHISGNFSTLLKGLGKRLKQRVISQNDAIDKVSQRLIMAYSGISSRRGPLAVFLFLGSSGVGKTELAKSLANELFGNDNAIIRLDMSEYQEPHSTAKLIGSPPGYIGYDEEGQLTSKLRTKPYSILLLDEVEKAHPKVFDLFLQLFDEGRITDAKGRTVDAKNCIVILTSNIKPDQFKRVGFGSQEEKPKVNDIPKLKKIFRPELLNRLDEQILFHPLEKEDIQRILTLILDEMCQRLKSQHNIELKIDKKAKELLVEKGYKPEFGARELRRTVERLLEAKVAEKLLEHQKMTTVVLWRAICLNDAIKIKVRNSRH